ncbi:MAG TPA: twin transmembrane helix small protein [Rhodopila sp.]|uniref:twin transmembrane helix small protein n=1 Tax=Rhodopila sp. TaxID=2480087 RepID=UPI002CECE9A7|nr:twin transmembrane helix small protein [Rhodopila sp.]HVY18207.1 twin transmembrane helix small protein [Rhodopila sp.]
MHAFLAILVGILLMATLGVLLAGAIGMARGMDPRRSNKLMQWRVMLQASALVLFILLMSMLRS